MKNALSDKDKRALALIRNKFFHEGDAPTLREINEVTGGKSPRSASLVVERLVNAGLLMKKGRTILPLGTVSSNSISTIKVPLVGQITCGTPILAEGNIQRYLQISTNLARKGSKYFLLQAIGDSMNKAGIKPGDLLLIRQQSTAQNGDKVVALIDDEATLKIFERKGDVVVLRPKSTNPAHKPIILSDNCLIQGVVIAVLPGNL